jgi:hypothetical protein
MRYLRVSLLLVLVCLSAGSCQIISWNWSTPASVTVGSTFVVEVSGVTDLPWGTVAAVLQLPTGFQAQAAAAHVSNGASTPIIARDDPLTLAAYTAEPAHTLAAFSGATNVSQPTVASTLLKVYIQAPLVPGTYTLKIALGGTPHNQAYQHQHPVGVTDFAQITTGVHAHTIQVNNVSAPAPFALASDGLWNIPNSNATRQPLLVDFDRDGRDDLLVAHTTNSPQIWLSRAFGWIPAGNVPIPGGSRFAVGDFDGDGFIDVVTSIGAVWFGAPGVTWSMGPILPNALNPSSASVATGDLDGDGHVDIALGDETGFAVFRSNTNRTFTPFGNGLPTPVPSLLGYATVALFDVERDGVSEMVRRRGSGSDMWRSDGLGNWQLVVMPPSVNSISLMIDLDGNGSNELLCHPAPCALSYIGQTLVPFPWPLPDTYFGAVDIDRDGAVDLLAQRRVGSSGPYQYRFEYWRNQGAAGFLLVPLPREAGFGMLYSAPGLAVGDIDGDSFPDLATIPWPEGPRVWRNTHTGAVALGEPCTAAGFATPRLSALGTVAPGQTITLHVQGLQPLGLGTLWAGTSKSHWLGSPVLPLSLGPIGAPGCFLLTEPTFQLFLVADALGEATIPVTLPNLAATQQLTFFAQSAAYSPGANALDFLFSGAVALKLQ